MNDNINKILNEKDAFLREIWAAGYDAVIPDYPNQELKLIKNHDGYIKRISMNHYAENYTIKTYVLYNGVIQSYLSEKDGSAERFRKIIKQ